MLRSIRNAFITGLVVILPLGVTTIVINFLLDRLGAPASRVFFAFLDPAIKALPVVELALQFISLVFVVALITGLGYFSKFFIGRFFLNLLERLLDRVPFINSVYRTVKQIVDTFSQQKKAVFQEVVLIEYPRRGSYALGFLTSTAKGETQAVTGEHIINVFVPTTPNPTSGFLLLLPDKDVKRLQMSITDGMKLIISGGAVVPLYDSDTVVTTENPSTAPEAAQTVDFPGTTAPDKAGRSEKNEKP